MYFFALAIENGRRQGQILLVVFAHEPAAVFDLVTADAVVLLHQSAAFDDLSIDTPLDGDEESATLLDFIADQRATAEEEVAATEYRQLINEKMEEFARTLKGKEQVIFTKRLLAEEPITLQQIGEQYGISRERVRQLESRLKKKLKDYLMREVKDFKDLDVGFVEER